VETLSAQLRERFPRLAIAGTHAPPFRPAGALEAPEVVEAINASKADVVWVGLGSPKQDYWMARHRVLLTAPVLIAVGAAFDFHAGLLPQAPRWMQRSGLEWVFRLAHEPRRLAYRYLVYNPLFVGRTALQFARLRRYPPVD
jgi:N-acetylglucosaminyldiphosphoundecaprenol N-acetyl-beta-D-mannosaminyltransferase